MLQEEIYRLGQGRAGRADPTLRLSQTSPGWRGLPAGLQLYLEMKSGGKPQTGKPSFLGNCQLYITWGNRGAEAQPDTLNAAADKGYSEITLRAS